jgi:5-methylcytosine-specific restriction endonuclease McrA
MALADQLAEVKRGGAAVAWRSRRRTQGVLLQLDLAALEELTDRAFRKAIFGAVRTAVEERRARRREEDRGYRRGHPEIFRHRKAIARARKRGASGSHTLEEWQRRLEAFAFRCAYCRRGDVELCRSRIVPPSRGGSNAIDNIVPACRPCNSRAWQR